MDILSMTCRKCGGKLQVNKDSDQILCQFCGTEYLVSFNEGAVSIKLLSEGIKNIAVSTDKTASELALLRIRKEKESLIVRFGEIAQSLDTLQGTELINEVSNSFTTEKEKNKFAPTVYMENCEELIKAEERFFFKDKKYINDLRKIRSELILLEEKHLNLTKQEKYHLSIVNND